MAAVRRRRRRRGILLSHGFALRASPAVKHGVSPPGTVGEHAMPLGRVYAIRVWARILMGFSGAIRVRVDRLIGISGVIRIFTFSRKRSLQKMVREGFRSFSKQDMYLIIMRQLYKNRY